MLFCSEQYLLFFGLVFAVYWAMPWQRARVYLLLAASFYFYASWNHWLAAIIAVSSSLDYCIARAMDGSTDTRRRKLLLSVTIAANLGLLCYFKYANFFLASLEQALRAAGATVSLPVLSVILPIGISFYTFEAINYAVDVYRRDVRAERSLPNFLLFITFFPHLVAGPIVRARDFLSQVDRPKRWNWARLNLGVQFFLMGLFKKLVIADRMALFADPVFAEPAAFRTSMVWLAMLAYSIQIYCDFSGYTDMAIGSAHMLGFKLAQNFNMPYLATNISDFWRRWHISLSSWLRDYLFIPLGGSRGGAWRTNRNLLVTMTLGGLWHGASWTFVAWGVLHGLLLVGHRVFRDFCHGRPRLTGWLQSLPGKLGCMVLTYLCVSLGWVLFRATTFSAAAVFFERLFVPQYGMSLPYSKQSVFVLAALLMACHLLVEAGWWKKFAERLPAPMLGTGYALVLSLALLIRPMSGKAFIYFQF